MTIKDSLIAINSFPIPSSFIEKIGIERGLDISQDYTNTIFTSKEYELCTADVYMFLYGQPILKEQDVSISQGDEIKKGFLNIANRIYKKYGDSNYTGKGTYGYIGEFING